MKVILYAPSAIGCGKCIEGEKKLRAFLKAKGDELEHRNIVRNRQWRNEALALETKTKKIPLLVRGSKKINIEDDWEKLYPKPKVEEIAELEDEEVTL